MTLKTEDWSNDAENTALITGINYILKCIKLHNLFKITLHIKMKDTSFKLSFYNITV